MTVPDEQAYRAVRELIGPEIEDAAAQVYYCAEEVFEPASRGDPIRRGGVASLRARMYELDALVTLLEEFDAHPILIGEGDGTEDVTPGSERD